MMRQRRRKASVATEELQTEQPPKPQAQPPAPSPLVLLVEDDKAVRETLTDLLAHMGCRVESAATLGDAARKFDRVRPACVLLDLMLPDGGGIQLLRRLRSAGSAAKVAIVSGVVDPVLRAKVAALRPDAAFPKPVDALELLAWVRTASAIPAAF